MKAYRRALDPKTAPKIDIGAKRTIPGSVNDLVVRSYRSDDFLGLKVKYPVDISQHHRPPVPRRPTPLSPWRLVGDKVDHDKRSIG